MKLTPEQLVALRAIPADSGPNRLRIAFALAGVRQTDACEALDLRPPQVSSLVRGDYKTVSIELGSKLATFFGCTIEDLFPTRVDKSEVA